MTQLRTMSKPTSFFHTFLADAFSENAKGWLALSASGYRSPRDCCLIASNPITDLSLELSQSNHGSQAKISL